jgi:hypothetical protein
MKSLALLGWLLVAAAAPAQDPTKEPTRAEDDRVKQVTAAIESMRKALADLPRTDETDQIRRSLDRLRERITDARTPLELARSDVEMLVDRVAWSDRMARKGFATPAQVLADRTRLARAEIELARAKKTLADLTGR